MSDTSGAPASAPQGTGADAVTMGADLESFEMGDNGYLEPVWGEESESADAPEAPAADAPAQPETHDYKQRYDSLRPEFDRATAERTQAFRALENAHNQLLAAQAELARYKGGAPAQAQPAAEEMEDVDLLEVFSDPQRGREYIQQQINRGVEEALGDHRNTLENMRLREELIDLAAKYPDFGDMHPYINDFYSLPENGAVPYEQAYHLVKRIHSQVVGRTAAPPASQETPGRAQAEPPATKVQLSGLQERAARLRTEQGIGGSADSAPAVKHAQSPREAFMQALQQHGGRV